MICLLIVPPNRAEPRDGLANAKLSDRRPTGKLERKWRSRCPAGGQAQERGGGSSPATGSRFKVQGSTFKVRRHCAVGAGVQHGWLSPTQRTERIRIPERARQSPR